MLRVRFRFGEGHLLHGLRVEKEFATSEVTLTEKDDTHLILGEREEAITGTKKNYGFETYRNNHIDIR